VPARAPRRLSSDARREQLAEIAQGLIARDGYAGFSLDELAERADVTRNLIYHYFPRGRLDLFLAAVHHGGEQMTGGWVTDPDVPLEERLAANFNTTLEHARGPSQAWLVHRQARAAGEPEIEQALGIYLERVIAGIALNHFGTESPAPLARAAIAGYLSFAETVLDEARAHGLPEPQVLELLGSNLLAAVAAVRQMDR
jgi:AcrR family transcriptional regulator